MLEIEHESMKKFHNEEKRHIEKQLKEKENMLIVALSLV